MRSQIPSSMSLLSALTICALVVVAGLASTAHARCIPFMPGSVATDGGSMLLVPDGSGPTLESQGASIVLQLWECPGEPHAFAGYPAQDMWLEGDDSGTLAFCAPGAIADGPTDEFGVATFTRALAGGGAQQGDVIVRTGGADFQVGSIAFVSPDMTGDLVVDLRDFASFGLDFGSHEARSDFSFDGVVDLSDFSIFGQAFGARCP